MYHFGFRHVFDVDKNVFAVVLVFVLVPTPQERTRAINRGLSDKLEKQVVAIMNEVRWHVEEWRVMPRSFHASARGSSCAVFVVVVPETASTKEHR